ncbi:hypothetical protein [Sphingomonas sp. 28-63-12]|uniref:hypothetical protein n=1 Tax=Sphingomonas sp. 28-63-12 TaxID=1970434 RepID=UPI000BD2F90F|nr:MAG: hypothetical protein B7Y47_13300 [Sphingomonas sp. 28-63-12]
MTSAKTIAAVRIARSLKPAEKAVNEAAIKVLAIGTAVLTARVDGTFHPLESQAAVDFVGDATAKVFGAMRDIQNAHRELRAAAVHHNVLGQGDIFETPPRDTPHGLAEPAIPLVAAA